ncbi:glycolipid 2-alpha-mannosyltransferase-domain-containing protein [Camillea tinctor]|nr:glycolipid 2-alpha-mannosyltransferase-domain-containing protein [Camillea tinctor]
MPMVYARPNAGPPGGQAARVPLRQAGTKGHTPSWSTSSNDGLGSQPMDLQTHKDDVSRLASTPTAMVDRAHNEQQVPSWALLARRIRPYSIRKIVVFMCLVFVIFGGAWMIRKDSTNRLAPDTATIDMYLPPIAQLPLSPDEKPTKADPIDWLRHNTILHIDQIPASYRESLLASRPKAAFIALVRNAEVDDMVHSISQLEARFNGRETHRYDWVFFNDEEFSEEFRAAVTNATSSRCFFEIIPEEHWSVPSWIDETRFDVGREFMGSIGVGKAWLQSYHHMCRWNAGLFALEKRLAEYDYFWRVEPGVEFSCDINYDVFRFMSDTDMAYGFNMAILDDARSFPSLWERTKTFIKQHKDMLAGDADLNWLVQDTKATTSTGFSFAFDQDGNVIDGIEYNNCQFYSNFEVGSLDFFRSKEHRAYFDHLDKAGGFYYERVGDAPVHTLSVSMFLPKSRIWYFRDIGYAHSLCAQCPPHKNKLTPEPETEPATQIRSVITNSSLSSDHDHWEKVSRDVIRQWGIPGLSCGCTVSAIDVNNAKLVPYESKQRKPAHPCIRLYLEGMWLEKKPDFNAEEEIAAGRDGSGGYLLDGLEGNPFQTI